MQVLFASRDPEAGQLKDLAGERLRLAMQRVAPPITTAWIRLDDMNGPRGGIDKRCTLELHTPGAGTLVVSARASDWRRAFEDALARITRSLVREWKRRRHTAAHSLKRQLPAAEPKELT